MDINVNTILMVAILAILIEAITSYGKLIFVEKKIQWQIVVTIIIGILISVVFQMDLFAILGFTAIVPWVGAVLTGIILSRGSNYVFSLIKLIMNAGDKIKE